MGSTPSIPLRRFASELRRLRRDAGLSHEDVSRATRIARNTLSRMEQAHGRPHLRTLHTLLDLYDVTEDERDALVALHKAAGEEAPAWLSVYDDALPGEYPAYVQFESEATMLRVWDAQVIPGLLQTADYARAIVEGSTPRTLTEREMVSRVQARMARQVVVLHRQNPLGLDVVLGQSALRHPIGGAAVMRDQIASLIKSSARPNISVRLVPDTTGAHPGLTGPFCMLEFERTAPVVYLENISGDVFLEEPEQVGSFRAAFERIAAAALSEEDSRRMLETMSAEIEE